MSLDITRIDNSKLRKAAEQADSQGNKAFNGKLDASEINVFIEAAKKEGCNMSEITSVVNQIGIDKNDKTSANKMKLMQEIEQLNKKIETKKEELAKREAKYNEMQPGIFKNTTQKVGTAIGAGLGAVVTAGVLATTLTLSGPVGWLALAGGAAVGGLAGAWDGLFISSMFADEPSYENNVKDHNATKYLTEQVYPLKDEIRSLEAKLASKLADLNK